MFSVGVASLGSYSVIYICTYNVCNNYVQTDGCYTTINYSSWVVTYRVDKRQIILGIIIILLDTLVHQMNFTLSSAVILRVTQLNIVIYFGNMQMVIAVPNIDVTIAKYQRWITHYVIFANGHIVFADGEWKSQFKTSF